MGYRGKLEQQQRARALRAQAWTLQEIADELGVAKSSVSLWVRDVDFAPRPRRTARRRGPNALQRRKQEEIDGLLREGRDRIGRLSEREFLVAGVALYAGEGAKTDGRVKLTNTNPLIIGFFCAWLRHFFEVDERRLRVTLYLHEGLDLEEGTRFWVCVTGIPPDQFSKPYRAEADATMRHTKHHNGCPAVAYACSRTHRAIMGLVHALIGGDVLPEMCGEAGR
jgi:transcriptional regulator with XRE-family HTH domain